MNIQDLKPGRYTLRVSTSDLGTGTSVTSSRDFYVLESYLSLAYNDYDKAVRQLRYIASERELRVLRAAEEDERLRMFRSFWASRDPTPMSRRNEALIEYYRRISYANEMFDVPHQEGWATDRGMVYITLGLPDYIERESFAAGSKPMEAWMYNSMRLTLLFVDDSGFGEYVLQNRQEYLERVQWRAPPPDGIR
jgi:GWxTD domain-containing protein